MIVTPLTLPGLLRIELKVHQDERGFFIERFNRDAFRSHHLPIDFLQDNHSRSHASVLRGLHYQDSPSQGKLVGVIRGRIWDVVVDIRPDSATFGKWHAQELSDREGRLLWIPGGFAHGFCVLGAEPADLLYKVDCHYDPASEGGICWSDPDLNIDWPIADPIMSPRDRALLSWRAFCNEHKVPQAGRIG